MKSLKILTLNPGSTSTKIAVYSGELVLISETIKHQSEELDQFDTIFDQMELRKHTILECLSAANIEIDSLDMVIGRGGLLKPISSGIYEVNEDMLYDLVHGDLQHASNLGASIAHEIAKTSTKGIKAYIADPVVVDEMSEIAKLTGHPNFKRRSIFHALNHKAVARHYAGITKKPYDQMNLIIAHMGGGVSVGAHQNGKVVDVNQALDGEGPVSPERSGSLPAGDLIRAAFSGKYSEAEMLKMVVGHGGMVAYLGTNDAYKIEQLAEKGDESAIQFYELMAYQVSKEIGSLATIFAGSVDAIILTGGLAKSDYLVDKIKARVSFLSKVEVFPGEDEMYALAMNGIWLNQGILQLQTYKGRGEKESVNG
ncbi:butyrate kinase [Persicobacter psychrovividus]|uniref:Probable butyrate kinase n=1 Tax=Persicobacter psychrovividus TaxID=387638 RepID=A0ABN6LJP9_9BACT|nr:butyrate kinase 2 [Persicobacter psychrovividus]